MQHTKEIEESAAGGKVPKVTERKRLFRADLQDFEEKFHYNGSVEKISGTCTAYGDLLYPPIAVFMLAMNADYNAANSHQKHIADQYPHLQHHKLQLRDHWKVNP